MNNPAQQAFMAWIEDSAQTLAALLTVPVTPGPPPDSTTLVPDDWDGYAGDCFSLPLTLSGAISGPMLMAVEDDDARTLASLMLGEDEPTEEMTKLHSEVLGEALQQLSGGLPESLASSIGLDGVSVVEGTTSVGPLPQLGAQLYQTFQFPLEAEGHTYTIHLIVPSMLAEELSNTAFLHQSTKPSAPASGGASSSVQQATFQPLSGGGGGGGGDRDLDLILDVPMQVTAVLGTTSISMEELIGLGKGSVLELDKLAGEPVELYVHGRQVAVGEVVVIDERFGVKILEMTSGRGFHKGNSLPQVV